MMTEALLFLGIFGGLLFIFGCIGMWKAKKYYVDDLMLKCSSFMGLTGWAMLGASILTFLILHLKAAS